ncbi:MAG: cell division protein ZapD [Gammaproteobacteria bacterium]|nr:cell division protein ZapD [Gammaproteobacteria bacterium]
MLIVGLTGGIGSGKSAAGARFQALGIPVIDADQVARDLCEPGQAGYQQIIVRAGHDILDPERHIDRKRLRELAFANPELRKTLEDILHPLIQREMQERTSTMQAPYCVFMIPLLVESGQHQTVDRVLVIDSAEEQQICRASLRDSCSRQEIQAIIATQATRKTRLSFADDVIHNIGDIDSLYNAVDRLDKKYRLLAQHKGTSARASSFGDKQKSDTSVLPTQPEATPAWLTQFANTTMTPEDNKPSANVFEVPLQERLRTFLRLEALFAELDHYRRDDCIWSSRNAIRVLLSIQQVFHQRPDTKTEMIKDCDRFYALFGRYTQHKNIDASKLSAIRDELRQTASALRAQAGKPGEIFRKNDLINQLKQKENVPGGATSLDVPCFAHWLNSPRQTRLNDIDQWLAEFLPLQTGTQLLLRILRESSIPQELTAKNGFYQATLDPGSTYNMIRVEIKEQEELCAEISGGQHRFTIHFLKPNGTSRPTALKKDVQFLLSSCSL